MKVVKWVVEAGACDKAFRFKHPLGRHTIFIVNFSFLERLLNALLSFCRRHSAIRQRKLDVFVHGEIADQVERLEDETDLTVANPGALRRGESGNRLTRERVLAV